MVQILPPDNTSSQLGLLLGSGLGQGISKRLSDMHQMKANTQSAEALSSRFGLQGDEKKQFVDMFKNIPAQDQLKGLGEYAKAQQMFDFQKFLSGDRNTSSEAPVENPSIKNISDDELVKFAASPYAPQREFAKAELDRRKAVNKEKFTRELAYEKLNGPKLAEVETKINTLNDQDMAYQRMNEILETEGDQFPSRWKAAIFDLEGEGYLSGLGRATLSAPVQEYSKLLINQLKGAKDTFGSRVTNFEAGKFIQGLPGLLNSPEGKKRILHQLSTVNEINRLHYDAILNEFEKAGGSGAISYSTAESRARKAIEPQIKELKKQFVKGESPSTSEQLKPVEPGTPLTDEKIAREIFNRAGGNQKEAERLAKEMGYVF